MLRLVQVARRMTGAVRTGYNSYSSAEERPTEGTSAPQCSKANAMTGAVLTIRGAEDRPTEGPAAPQGSGNTELTGALRTFPGAGDRHTKWPALL